MSVGDDQSLDFMSGYITPEAISAGFCFVLLIRNELSFFWDDVKSGSLEAEIWSM